jgi:hypothetical protein
MTDPWHTRSRNGFSSQHPERNHPFGGSAYVWPPELIAIAGTPTAMGETEQTEGAQLVEFSSNSVADCLTN